MLNEAALAGVDKALAPLGVFINTTYLDVLPNGQAALRTNVKVIPSLVR